VGHTPDAHAVQHPPQDPEGAFLTQWQQWVVTEQFRERMHWQPWRPLPDETEEACDDPDRIVVFDDIAGHLFRVESPQLKVSVTLCT
jgi:hypothetical protein